MDCIGVEHSSTTKIKGNEIKMKFYTAFEKKKVEYFLDVDFYCNSKIFSNPTKERKKRLQIFNFIELTSTSIRLISGVLCGKKMSPILKFRLYKVTVKPNIL